MRKGNIIMRYQKKPWNVMSEKEKNNEVEKTKEIIIEAGIKDEQINQIEMPPK